MYLQHFGFREYPFSLTPDTEYFYGSGCHSDVLNVLQVALRSGEGFIAVTAEVGLGKTLLCRLLLRELDKEFTTAYIPDPLLSPRTLRSALAEELGIELDEGWTDDQLMRRIQKHLIARSGESHRVVLLLDEAHQLPPQTLEAVRLLTNLETEKFKLLQVVLFGQPELDRRLAQPSLRQLRQRIGFRCTLAPLDRKATEIYVAHRVRVAGCTTDPLFAQAAVNEVYEASGGTPRLINMLCHKALMAAFGRGEYGVNSTHMRRAIADSSHAVVQRSNGLGRLARWFTTSFARKPLV
ncbi:MAG: AAA family ATPase [Gammaproteobacteria bacterium]|nr:AAA family ATPase [Gammaproteobacteria bacterium]NNF60011.1 AAA family ATPase [Gammaproteobacteria bacterium]NNM20085.1 AAA family ATPase [Gammaproteobacteria bacterium]